MKKYNIIRQEVFPHKDYNKWMLIKGHRGPSGNPVGVQGKDWWTIDANLSYESAKRLALTLNAIGV